MSVETRKPWEKQMTETAEDFRLFVTYRDDQNRSLARVSEKTGVKGSTVQLLCAKFNWRARTEEWDRELDRRVQEAQVDEVKAMRARHINVAIGMQTAATKELAALIHKIEQAHMEAVKAGKKHHEPILNVLDLTRLIVRGTSIERLSRGEPTSLERLDSAEQENEEMLGNLSTAELKILKSLRKKMRP